MLAIWSLVPLLFLNPAWTSGSFWFTYFWSLTYRMLSMTLPACEMSATEHSLALPFFGIGMNTDLFQSYGHCWVLQICWHIECSTFTALSFRIWNSSAGIPSPPLAGSIGSSFSFLFFFYMWFSFACILYLSFPTKIRLFSFMNLSKLNMSILVGECYSSGSP